MFTIFLFCAVIAGTVFIFQLVMTFVGFGLEGADLHTDLPHDVHADFGDHGDWDAAGAHAGDIHGEHGSSWLFGVISLRTIVAALTFFGLAGMAALSGLGDGVLNHVYATLIALAAGAGAMFGVHFVMRTLYRLGSDGTLRLSNTLGGKATVYLTIPAAGAGRGKVQMRVQGRLVELAAVTKQHTAIPTGSPVKVVGLVGTSTLEVELTKDVAAAEVAVSH